VIALVGIVLYENASNSNMSLRGVVKIGDFSLFGEMRLGGTEVSTTK